MPIFLMSFGGHVSSMIASLKRNKRKKRAHFFDQDLSEERKVNSAYLKEASPEVMADIKKQISEQKRQDRIKLVLALVLGGIVVWWVFYIIYSIGENVAN